MNDILNNIGFNMLLLLFNFSVFMEVKQKVMKLNESHLNYVAIE